MWIAGLALLVNVAVGYAASYLFPAPPREKIEQTFARLDPEPGRTRPKT
jgi:hypothetical protein